MAATAAVSPSDYLQPAASTTQVSGQRVLRAGGCISLEAHSEADIKPPRKTLYWLAINTLGYEPREGSVVCFF